jgi:L-threonylcarbamoyladenylate synthase
VNAKIEQIDRAVQLLKSGGVIAYPTEAVYGLGCDPWNQEAVHHLLLLKHRSVDKGLILLAGSLEQVEEYLIGLTAEQKNHVLATWPGPVTWLVHATEDIPEWITGGNPKVAIRVTAHPLSAELALAFGKPIVSTSANHTGESPLLTAESVRSELGHRLDYILEGDLGGLEKPTEIRDASTGHVIRGV